MLPRQILMTGNVQLTRDAFVMKSYLRNPQFFQRFKLLLISKFTRNLCLELHFYWVSRKKIPSYISIQYSFFINFQKKFPPTLLFRTPFLLVSMKSLLYTLFQAYCYIYNYCISANSGNFHIISPLWQFLLHKLNSCRGNY